MHFPNKNEVFYNKVQVLNRDLSITMIRLHGERLVKERREKAEKKVRLATSTANALSIQTSNFAYIPNVTETPQDFLRQSGQLRSHG